MFTGIVEEIGSVAVARPAGKGFQLSVHASTVTDGTKLGDSIAVNGVCLTVTHLDQGGFTVGVAPETLQKTNIRFLRPGHHVNLERALLPTTRLGGHFVQGHVDAVAILSRVQPDRDALWLTLQPPPDLLKYIVEKGFVCLDGVSLTVVNVTSTEFTITLVSYTQDSVTLSEKRPGSKINVEVDILGKYIEKLMSTQGETHSGLNASFLRKHGFH